MHGFFSNGIEPLPSDLLLSDVVERIYTNHLALEAAFTYFEFNHLHP